MEEEEDFEKIRIAMNNYVVSIRLTDGSRRTMPVRANTADAAERIAKDRYPVRYKETESIKIQK